VVGGALAAALADTTGTEVGQLIGRRAFSLRSLREVPAGTPGAVSAAGTAAGAGASTLIGLIGGVLAFYPPGGIVAVAAGGTAGSLLESVIGSFRSVRALGHTTLNAANTVLGGAVALAIFALLGS
jgi:uncharacterized protein (TIGR00297 family)